MTKKELAQLLECITGCAKKKEYSIHVCYPQGWKSMAKLTEKGISLKVHPMQPEPNLSKVGLLSKVNTSFQEVSNFHFASQMLLLNTAAIGRMISVTSTDFNHQTF